MKISITCLDVALKTSTVKMKQYFFSKQLLLAAKGSELDA